VVYIGSLITMLINSFFYLDGFTGKVIHEFTLKTYASYWTQQTFRFFPHYFNGCQCDNCVRHHRVPLSYYMARLHPSA